MNEGPMKRGIWRGWYTDDNGIERYESLFYSPYSFLVPFPKIQASSFMIINDE